jgi:hypothetical protein
LIFGRGKTLGIAEYDQLVCTFACDLADGGVFVEIYRGMEGKRPSRAPTSGERPKLKSSSALDDGRPARGRSSVCLSQSLAEGGTPPLRRGLCMQCTCNSVAGSACRVTCRAVAVGSSPVRVKAAWTSSRVRVEASPRARGQGSYG